MTKHDLDELDRLRAAATVASWQIDQCSGSATTAICGPNKIEDHVCIIQHEAEYSSGPSSREDANAAYIVAACNSNGALVAGVRRLRREIEAAGKNPAGFDWSVLERLDRLEKAEEEAQRLRAELADTRGALKLANEEMRSLATGEPMANGDYGHLCICSASRRFPAGIASGCVCNPQLKKALAFKSFVHRYLDDMGVPAEILDGPHSKEVCRIVDRLDWVFAEMERLRASFRSAVIWLAARGQEYEPIADLLGEAFAAEALKGKP